MPHLIGRVAALGPQRRRLLAEAAGELATASLALAVLPFRRAIRLGDVAATRAQHSQLHDFAWAVRTAARHVPWRAVCIQQGLALHRMLRRRGVDAVLHYGVGRREDRDLHAHVWVSVDGEILIGGEAAAGVREVARYPDQRAASTVS